LNKEKQCGISNLRLFKPFIFQNENLSLLLIREKHWNFVVSIFLLLTPPTYSTLSFHQKTNKQTKKSTKKNNQTKKKPKTNTKCLASLCKNARFFLLLLIFVVCLSFGLDNWKCNAWFCVCASVELKDTGIEMIILMNCFSDLWFFTKQPDIETPQMETTMNKASIGFSNKKFRVRTVTEKSHGKKCKSHKKNWNIIFFVVSSI